MKNISLSVPAGPGLGGANLVEMKRDELLEVEGGIIPLLIIGVLLLGGCATTREVAKITSTDSCDSTCYDHQ